MDEVLTPEDEALARQLALVTFAWDIERALEFALFRTYAVPAISGLLARTGKFEAETRRRYDDTELLLAEPMENGLGSDRGREAVERINAIHARFRIDNAEMLYVLTTFVLEPVRWMQRFGKRPFTADERRAWTNSYRALGRQMGIIGIPDDYAGFEAHAAGYEAAHFRYADSNRRIGTVTLELLLGFYMPRVLFPVGRLAALSLMDGPLLAAMGFRAPPAAVRRGVLAAMRVRATVLRLLPARRKPRLITARKRPSYPGGYLIRDLGATRPRPGPVAPAGTAAERS